MPFYRALVPAAHNAGVRVLAVAAEIGKENTEYLERNGVHTDDTVELAKTSLTVTGTPTLILVRRDGYVVRTWSGKLTENGQNDVLTAVTAR
jgi:hypothetical protein